MASPLLRSYSNVSSHLIKTTLSSKKRPLDSKTDSAFQKVIKTSPQAELDSLMEVALEQSKEDKSLQKSASENSSVSSGFFPFYHAPSPSPRIDNLYRVPSRLTKQPCEPNALAWANDGNFEMAGHFLFWISNKDQRAVAIAKIFDKITAKSKDFEDKLAFVHAISIDQIRDETLEILFNRTLGSWSIEKGYLSHSLRIIFHFKSEELKILHLRELVIATYYNNEDIKELDQLIKRSFSDKIPQVITQSIELLCKQASPDELPDLYIKTELLNNYEEEEGLQTPKSQGQS